MDPNTHKGSQGYPTDQPPAYQFQQPATAMPMGEAPYPAPPQGYAYPEPPLTQHYPPPNSSTAQYPYLAPGGQPAYPMPQPNPAYPTDSKAPLQANTVYPAPPPFKGDAPIVTQPAPVPAATTVIIQQQSLGKHPQMLFCPHCQKNVNSQIEHVAGAGTWISSGLCFCFGCWLCCCIPFCMDDLQDTEHRCPECKTLLGTKKCL
eukprot:comp22657_c0_seq1/m.34958 comp22657_c0_seq1/g.34958  ORF comp22657_c0_seq1/g.34958 comp22657_c0_seq1/m.34958 type:complete len:204 (-) comp22657_c0_seq1:739-1350(-)